MSGFMYHGILISRKTCRIPYSYIVDYINDIVSYLKGEKYIEIFRQNGGEIICISPLDDKRDIICHVHDKKISFSKLYEKEMAIIYDEDILDIIDRLHYISRDFNKYAFAYSKKDITFDNVVNRNIAYLIIEKDKLEFNHHYTIELDLIQNKEIIDDDYKLKYKLDEYKQEHEEIVDFIQFLRDEIEQEDEKKTEYDDD